MRRASSAKRSPTSSVFAITWRTIFSQAACISAGELLDNALRKRLGDTPRQSPRWAALSDRFATATRLEVAFWELGRA